jgi:hypothetical protein
MVKTVHFQGSPAVIITTQLLKPMAVLKLASQATSRGKDQLAGLPQIDNFLLPLICGSHGLISYFGFIPKKIDV